MRKQNALRSIDFSISYYYFDEMRKEGDAISTCMPLEQCSAKETLCTMILRFAKEMLPDESAIERFLETNVVSAYSKKYILRNGRETHKLA